MTDISVKRTAQDKFFITITYDAKNWSDVKKMYLLPKERVEFTVLRPMVILTPNEEDS